MTEEHFWASACELAALMRRGEVSPVEFTRSLLERITESELNAFSALAMEQAPRDARVAEERLASGEFDEIASPLLGVPVSIKDNIETKGLRTTYGSRVFADHVPDHDAVVVERLRAAGAIVIGKTTLPEFATKGVVDSPLLGVTRNPWDTSRVVGGSSGGAAAAVAAGLGPLAIGNDQAGSVRIPAALNGVTGLKPSAGRIPFSPNLSPWDNLFQVGIISRTVDDLELVLGVLEGPDGSDPLSLPRVLDEAGGIGCGRVAWSEKIGFAQIEPEVLTLVRSALDALTPNVEVTTVDIDLSPAELAYSTLVPFKRALEIGHKLDDWAPTMDPEVVAYVRSGQEISIGQLREATDHRTRVFHEVERVLADYDYLITPTLSVPAFPVGQTTPALIDGVPTASFRDWFPYTYPFNLSGHPAVSVPAGWTSGGLPVGIQVVGRRFCDRQVLALARLIEEARPWADRRPDVH